MTSAPSGTRVRGSATLVGVLYAEDFDDVAVMEAPEEPLPEPEIIEPMFTAAELEAARAEARTAARAEAERGINASRAQMLAAIAAALGDAREGARVAAEQSADAVARCMLTALTACLPSLCARHGATEVRALARAVLPALVDEPQVTVRVNPYLVATMQTEIDALDADLVERIRLLPAEAISPGDARITWADGAATRNTARARTAVQEALAVLGLLEPELIQPEMTDA